VQFGSRQNAEDVRALVEAMGIRNWNAYGVSYGTRTAVELLRLDPAGLRAVVLDSAVPSDVPLVSESVLRGNEVLVRVLADCRQTPSCDAAFPDASGQLERILDRLAAAPQRRDFPGGVVVTVDDSQVLFVLQSLLTARVWAEQIPLMIDQMDRDISAIDQVLQALVADQTVSDGVYLSVACREIPRTELDPASLGDPFLRRLATASAAGAAFGRLCGVWGLQYEATPGLGSSDIPVLILNGEIDPVVRPEWTDRVSAGLRESQTFTIPGEAHAPGDSLCGSRVLSMFLDAPQQKSTPTLRHRAVSASIRDALTLLRVRLLDRSRLDRPHGSRRTAA
jgi:pimeloyl-ACP methyl ester carboxylesterase